MIATRFIVVTAAALWLSSFQPTPASAVEMAPHIASLSKPQAGSMQMVFQGGNGPFQIQKRTSATANAPWFDIVDAKVTQINPEGVYLATFPLGTEDAEYYRVVTVGETITELKGWFIQVGVAAPTNGLYFAVGERPVVTVKLLDTFAQGMSRADFSSLNLYLYGPLDPQKTVTASKLLNASTNRAARPHHYIDLKTNPDVQVNNNVMTYQLQPVTDEAPGTYVATVWSVLAADPIQQIMRTTDLQIGTATVESPVVTKSKCAVCHEGPISGKTYLHHIDPAGTYFPKGNWSLDYEPVRTCLSCHNNDGYAAFTDLSVPGVTNTVADAIVRRAHGVHMGKGLKLAANTNSVNGVFREYTEVVFPADVRDCAKCHVDDRWKTSPSRQACGSCHDTTWFGTVASMPPGMEAHAGGPRNTDTGCSICHPPGGPTDDFTFPIATVHQIPAPAMDAVNVSMTAPANGQYYVAGEKPVVTLTIYDDTGTNAIDHTKVTDANFSTASLFVYGPRSLALPVLTSTAKNVNSKLRASVTSSKAGPWDINGKVFKIAVNGSAPQEITIVGASNLVTAAEVVASLNRVVTNLNAKASVSGANVNLKTTIQGANARFEIYDGDVTAAMGWKRPPNTTMEPDVTVAVSSFPANDLRALSDPLDYSDPMVTRSVPNITYQLDDVASLAPGTYNVYVYHLPKAGKIPGLAAPTGIGHMTFQVGTATPEKKVATNCKDCHGETIWHLAEGPMHPEPFDTDYCTACHDYSHTSTGDMFKNQGGTSLNGWSGFGAVPISRRVHGVHYAHYLEHSEEIYANATKQTFGGIIFPQDVRNCTKCHSESDAWKENPSRVACLACHDSDAAKAHGKLMTLMPNPYDPYGSSATESCEVCHGSDADFSPDKVHSIANPYVPPYPREPAE